MISAVVLLNSDLDSHDKVLESLKMIEGVEEAHALYGVYDFLVKIKALSIDELKNILRSKVKQIGGINSTLTLMINDSQ